MVFDFDGTIKREADEGVASDFVSILEDVQRDARKVLGLATLSCTVDYIKNYLYRNVSSSAFSWDFLRSNLAQYCAEPKGLQVQLVHAAMGGGVPRDCVIIWDDSLTNRQSTIERGMQFQLVKSAGVGVTWQDYWAGIAQLRARGCGC